MSLQTPSKEKLLKTSVASFVEAHPEASMHNIAVLFTDVVGSTKYFKKHGDIKGREMLRRHHRIAISIVEEFGGSLIKEVGDSVMVYFPDALNALKAGIKMQHQFNLHNKTADSQNQIRIRVGIHYGKVIVEEKDIYGDVVNVASKLTNLANGDQLFVSHVIYEMTKNTSGAKYELINFWNLKNVPIGLTIYKVVWEDSPVTEAEKMAIVQFRLKENAAAEGFSYFNRIWQTFVDKKDSFLAGTHNSEYLSPEGTLVVSFKDSTMALNLAERTLEYLIAEMKNTGSDQKPPVHIVITKDTHPKGNLLPIQKSKIDVQAFSPGDIYMSKSIFDDVRKQRVMSSTPPPIEHRGKAFYRHVTGTLLSTPPEISQQKKAPQTAIFATCFYCGSKQHDITHCPTKHLTEATHALSDAGYLSDDRLRMLVSLYANVGGDTSQSATAALRADARGEQELITNSLFEITSVYQLRFFKTIWESTADSWEKAKKNISVSEGGFSWLALDSLRVSNHGRAESYLKTALEHNPKDYKPYCIIAFLNIERNELIEALKNFESALLLARTAPHKMFLYLLQARIYLLLGNTQKAQDKLNLVLTMDSTCSDALYEDIKLKLKQERGSVALQRLSKLINEDKKYYTITTIDPDMKSHSKTVNELLIRVMAEAKKEAQDYMEESRRKFDQMNSNLTKENREKAHSLVAKMDELAATDSYYGYLDIGQLAQTIISMCNNAVREQKRNLSESMSRINRRLEKASEYIRRYRYPALAAACSSKLQLIRSGVRGMGSIDEYSSADQFEQSGMLCIEIARQLGSVELAIKKLEFYQQSILVSLNFMKYAGILLGIVFFVGVLILPLISGPIDSILSQANIAAIQSASSFQKVFLISGGILSLMISFLVTARKVM